MSGFDWHAAHERLEALQRALASGGRPSTEEAKRILERRARDLAQVPVEPAAHDERLDLLVFSRSNASYGVSAADVVEVLPAVVPASLPGSRAGLAGVVGHRGRVLAVLDLGRLRQPARPADRTQGNVVVVESLGMTVGLLADDIAGLVSVATSTLTPGTSGAEAWLQGTTADLVSVLELPALLQDPRIRVEE